MTELGFGRPPPPGSSRRPRSAATAVTGRAWRRSRRLSLSLSLALLGSACGPEAELREPVPLFDEVPMEYPLSLWDERVEGTTVLRVWVSESGSVDSTRILESSGRPAFDSAAVRGGRRLRFQPATRGGEPVGIWAEVPVHFTLDGSEVAGSDAPDGTSEDPTAPGSSSPDPIGSDPADDGGSASGAPADGS